MPKIKIELMICDCGCGDTLVRQVLCDGQLVAAADLEVLSNHGWVGTNAAGQTEIYNDDAQLVETIDA